LEILQRKFILSFAIRLCDSAQTLAALKSQLSVESGTEVSLKEMELAISGLLDTRVLLSMNDKLLSIGVNVRAHALKINSPESKSSNLQWLQPLKRHYLEVSNRSLGPGRGRFESSRPNHSKSSSIRQKPSEMLVLLETLTLECDI
jgi:hypothetical protein